MLLRRCDICEKEIRPFATDYEPEEDADNGFFRLMLDDFTKCTPGGVYLNRKYIDVCPDCFSEAMDGTNSSLILRKLIGPKYDWNEKGLIVE